MKDVNSGKWPCDMALQQRKKSFNGGISVAFGAPIDDFAHLVVVRYEGAVRGKYRVV
jgi:hypothetical protein